MRKLIMWTTLKMVAQLKPSRSNIPSQIETTATRKKYLSIYITKRRYNRKGIKIITILKTRVETHIFLQEVTYQTCYNRELIFLNSITIIIWKAWHKSTTKSRKHRNILSLSKNMNYKYNIFIRSRICPKCETSKKHDRSRK